MADIVPQVESTDDIKHEGPQHHTPHHSGVLPTYHRRLPYKHVRRDGESYRKGIHPLHFLNICFRSSCTLSKYVNLLWPVVPVALAMHWARPDQDLWNFILPYMAMIPAANLLGFAGQELARKVPLVLGVILETTLGSIVEIVLFMVLVKEGEKGFSIIKAAILGSILANLLLCLGLCFFAGGLRRDEQVFHEAVSEVGSNLMLVAGMALVLPAIFDKALATTADDQKQNILDISRATAILLLISYVVYLFFQMRSHHSIYNDLLYADEEKDTDKHRDQAKAKLTLTESLVALAVAITIVVLMAIFLVDRIEYLVEERHVSDAFLGLILVPLVEKAAEHITAVDEAWDNQMNFALAHVLGSSIQTALLNTPLVVLVGWGIGAHMDLSFEIFDAAALILAILVVGNFLRDGKSNYLEGFLCVLVYAIIAISAYYYPNPTAGHDTADTGNHSEARMMTRKWR